MHMFDRLKDKLHHGSEGSSKEPKMAHATAKVNGTVIADADHYEKVEGNIYVYYSGVPNQWNICSHDATVSA